MSDPKLPKRKLPRAGRPAVRATVTFGDAGGVTPEPGNRVVQPRHPLVRATVTFEPVDPNAPPANPGPLLPVRRPFRKFELQPDNGFDMELSLDSQADAGEVFTRVCDLITQLDRYARASGGAGITLDTRLSKAVPGTVTLRLVPDDPGRGTQQAEAAKQEARRIPGVSEVHLLGV